MVQLEQIMNFDLSKRQNTLILLLILGVYSGITSFELFVDECTGYRNCYDFDRRMSRLYVWDTSWIEHDFRHFIHLSLLTLSDQLFHNYKVLVLVSSVLLLYVTYLLATSITKKRIGGLLAIGITLQSSIFYNYDTSVTYPSFWALLFLSSIYFTRTKYWFISPILFIISVPAKALTALFLPALLLFVLFSDTKEKKKILITYLIIIAVGLAVILGVPQLSSKVGGFLLFNNLDIDKFTEGFFSWIWKGFGSDQLTIVFLAFGTSILLSKKIKNGKAVVLLCFGMILMSPVIIGMTTYDVWPYRMLPIVSGISIMIALVFTNMDKWIYSFLNRRSLKEQVK